MAREFSDWIGQSIAQKRNKASFHMRSLQPGPPGQQQAVVLFLLASHPPQSQYPFPPRFPSLHYSFLHTSVVL